MSGTAEQLEDVQVVKLLPHQLDFMARDDDPLVIMCTGISAGKTFAASCYIAKELYNGKRLIVSAQNYDALHRVVFTETMKRLEEFGIQYSYNKTAKEIHVGDRGLAFGMTSENPTGILGLSNIDCLVMDEAAYQCEEAYNWASDRLRGPEVKIPKKRLFSSPDSFNQVHEWFKNLCAKYPKAVINASALDNYKNSEEFRAELIERYPPGTDLYEQQILGRFVDSRSANVAIDDRTFMNTRPAHSPQSPVWVGCDIAGQGRDDSVFIVIDEYGFIESARFHHSETQQLVSQLLDYSHRYIVAGVAIDGTGGFGTGLYDYSKSSFKQIDSINFGSKADDDTYNNIRTQMHFELRKSAEGSNLYVPNSDDGQKIREETRHALYYIDPKGRTALFPKEDVKRALGRSPDALDALILANHARCMTHGTSKKTNSKQVAARIMAAWGR